MLPQILPNSNAKIMAVYNDSLRKTTSTPDDGCSIQPGKLPGKPYLNVLKHYTTGAGFRSVYAILVRQRCRKRMEYERLKELREDKDLTQQQVADLLFINRRTYSAYENGTNSMSPPILIKLANIFNTSVDYIVGLTDERKPYPHKKVLKRAKAVSA